MATPCPSHDPAVDDPATQAPDIELCVHLFSVSAGLVGVCLTVIGLLRVVLRLARVDGAADDILAVNAVGFLVATIIAYLAIRTGDRARRRRWERVADRVFLGSLILMTVVCALIAYELA